MVQLLIFGVVAGAIIGAIYGVTFWAFRELRKQGYSKAVSVVRLIIGLLALIVILSVIGAIAYPLLTQPMPGP
jgi:hypothetical protein